MPEFQMIKRHLQSGLTKHEVPILNAIPQAEMAWWSQGLSSIFTDLHAKIEVGFPYHSYTKTNSKSIKDLSVRAKTETLRRKHKSKCLWLWVRENLLRYDIKKHKTTEAKSKKISRKLKSFVLQSIPSRKNGRNYLQSIYLIRDMYLEHVNNSYKSIIKRIKRQPN